jgi:hypothetical protein
MRLIVEIDTPDLLPQLRAELEAGGCSTEAVSPYRCRVIHDEAADVVEAFDELGFFVRAWAQSQGDVAVRLRPDV